MNMLQQFLSMFGHLLKWYFVVEPWDMAIRVRFGKGLVLFGPGLHFKVPYADVLYCQNVRRRVMGLGNQTTTTRDGAVITVNGSLGFRIADVLKLHQTLHDADGTITLHVSGAVARYVARNDVIDCTPEKITAAVQSVLTLEQYGLADVEFFMNSYVSNIPAIRLINDSIGGVFYGSTSLSTNNSSGAPSSSPR